MVEQRGHNHKRNGIAERQAMIAGIGPKHAFSFVPHAIAVGNNLKTGLDLAEKRERDLSVTRYRSNVTVSLIISQVVQNVVPAEAALPTRSRARAWFVSFGSRQA
jgi:hypothetical protein